MNKQQRQHISALADNELDPALVRTTVSALGSNERLLGAWERYHLIGAALRSESVRPEYRLLSARVSECIAAEPITPKRSTARPAWVFPLAGAALAVGLAFAALVTMPQLFRLRPDSAISPGPSAVGLPPEPFRLAGPVAPRWQVAPALESKLDRFLVTHQAQSPVSGMIGFLPYATLVGYGARR